MDIPAHPSASALGIEELPDDFPVFALFNASKNVRLPDKIDHALHCPVRLRLTPRSLDFRQVPSAAAPPANPPIVRTRSTDGVALPRPTTEWQSILFTDIVHVKSYCEPFEDPGKTQMQLGVPAAFRVNWCPKTGGSRGGCCGGAAAAAHRVFASAVFVFGSTLAHEEPPETDDASVDGSAMEESEVKLEAPEPVFDAADPFLQAARQWAVRIFLRAFPERADVASLHAESLSQSPPTLPAVLSPELGDGTLSRNSSSNALEGTIKSPRSLSHGISIRRRHPSHLHRRLTVHDLISARRHVLVFVNPASGDGGAEGVFDQGVAPLFRHARIEHDLVVTTHPQHAREHVRGVDLTQYEGIVCVGGSGLVSEVVHGLMDRADWAQAARTPIAGIPAGTVNGLPTSLLHLAAEPVSAFNAAFLVARGATLSKNIAQVTTPTAQRYCFLSFGWAITADAADTAERWRCCGPARFACGAWLRSLHVRRYSGELWYRPGGLDIDDAPATGPVADAVAPSGVGVELTSAHADHVSSPTATHGPVSPPAAAQSPERLLPSLPPFSEPLGAAWKHMSGRFAMVAGCNLGHSAPRRLLTSASPRHRADVTLFVAEDLSRAHASSVLAALRSGRCPDVASVKHESVSAFRLIPGGNRGVFYVDGERMEACPVQVEVFPSLLTVYGYVA